MIPHIDLGTKGFVHGDGSMMIDPHKVGRVMWAMTHHGMMAPFDLHGTLSMNDLENLHVIFKRLMAFRKVNPALEYIRGARWDNMPAIMPYLVASVEGRSESRAMMSLDEWEPFWHSLI